MKAGDKLFHPGSLSPARGSTRRGRYLGRGRSSGHGKTSSRGMKGQFSRTGAKRRPGFVGGDIPLILKMPKRGFVSPFKVRYRLVNVGALENAFESNAEVTPAALVERGLISTERPAVKILGDGSLSKSLKVSAHAFSGPAKEKIAAAGGTCALLRVRGAS
jgi:large subunit ribosomal protein L15